MQRKTRNADNNFAENSQEMNFILNFLLSIL